MMISFTNTTGPGLQDISLLQLGYNLTSKSDITDLMLVHLSRIQHFDKEKIIFDLQMSLLIIMVIHYI
jgi:hypothetical protein